MTRWLLCQLPHHHWICQRLLTVVNLINYLLFQIFELRPGNERKCNVLNHDNCDCIGQGCPEFWTWKAVFWFQWKLQPKLLLTLPRTWSTANNQPFSPSLLCSFSDPLNSMQWWNSAGHYLTYFTEISRPAGQLHSCTVFIWLMFNWKDVPDVTF